MKLVEMKCKNCGGELKIEDGADTVTCPYCNITYKIDDEVKHVKYDDMENSGYEFEKGRLKAQTEHFKNIAPISTKFILIPIIAIIVFITIAVVIGAVTRNKQGFSTGSSFEVSASSFNMSYDNGRQPGVFVEDDIADIIESNKKYSEKKITVKYEDKETSDPDEILELKKSMDFDIYYEISLDYDSEGYVNLYTIEKAAKTAQEIEHERLSFNAGYNNGNWFGNSIGYQLDRVIENNKTNEERKITVKYKDIETVDPDEIVKIKDMIAGYTEYEVSFDYDSDGFITTFIIND